MLMVLGRILFVRDDNKLLGIRCMIVEPGPFRTDFVNEQTSATLSDIEIEDYKEQSEGMRNFNFSGHQQQPGDPAKLAVALMRAVHDANPPFRFVAGKGIADFAINHLQRHCSEYEAWREVSDRNEF